VAIATMPPNFSSTANEIWAVADLLRGDFKQSQYGRIILPFALLRRLECVLAPTKAAVLAKLPTVSAMPVEAQEKLLLREAKKFFYNTSPMDLGKLGETDTARNLETYIQSFSADAREIFEHFKFADFIHLLDDANLLYLVIQRFASWDLSPKAIDNHHMGLVFEELIRKFAESSNETAGEHFTPRDIVRLTTALVFVEDDELLTLDGIVRSIYDPTGGTGGMISSGMEYVHELNPRARLAPFGQELNPESYAICKADMLIKGQDVTKIRLGNTLSDDQLAGIFFDYMLSNPPFGVDWKKIQKTITDEHQHKGHSGRFGPGLPRVSDGSLLFLLHLVSKMRPLVKGKDGKMEGGSRIGIILNGSPLFTGGAGSGESEIRRHLLENDLVEAIVALPTDMFYNTGIATYIWILSNNKPAHRKGSVQLIHAVDCHEKMRKSLGSKRKQLSEDHVTGITRLFASAKPHEPAPGDLPLRSKLFPTTAFGYRRITVERPLQLRVDPQNPEKRAALAADAAWGKLDPDEQGIFLEVLDTVKTSYLSRTAFLKDFKAVLKPTDYTLSPGVSKILLKHLGEHDDDAEICKDAKGNIEPNPDLRDNENVPLGEDIHEYFAREVTPHVPLAWIDESKRDDKDGGVGTVGYEIPFNRHFYTYSPPRQLDAIDTELATVTGEIQDLLQEVAGA
jgi:type I restriction enzyme M protein